MKLSTAYWIPRCNAINKWEIKQYGITKKKMKRMGKSNCTRILSYGSCKNKRQKWLMLDDSDLWMYNRFTSFRSSRYAKDYSILE
ncbi:hypothetical protein GLOIN_2v1778872 [Rhizophagus irregularis DAOM 181602=DAOM 197198]|nr:hypothetical protein GLOIN_2v1778872 [Rhizophagus irregularis DAOM 181602=DAOM 197198]